MKRMMSARRTVSLAIVIFLCFTMTVGLCDTRKTARDTAYEAFYKNPTENNLIAFANAAFGKASKFTSTSPMPAGKTGIALLFDHKKYGTILLIVSKTNGNLFWRYDQDSVPDACMAFSLAASQYDVAVFMNERSGTSLQGAGSEVTPGMSFMFVWDIGSSIGN